MKTTLSNGQTVEIEKTSNGKAIRLSLNGKSVITFEINWNKEEIMEEILGYGLDGINTPELVDFKKFEDYDNALTALYNEVADAVLSINEVAEVKEPVVPSYMEDENEEAPEEAIIEWYLPEYPNAIIMQDEYFYSVNLRTGLGAGIYPKSDFTLEQAIHDQIHLYDE